MPQASRRLIQTWLQRNAHPASDVPAQPPTTQSSATKPCPRSEPKSEPRLEPKDSTLVSNAGNRRGEHRFACRLGADVYHLGTSVPNRCTLSDISESGCYVEMTSPFARQSGVEILVRTADTKLTIRGQVMATHPGFGMGVRFMLRDSGEREKILRLLAVLSTGPELDEQPR